MNSTGEIDQLFRGAVDRNEIPGVMAIVASKDRIIYHQAFGKMDVANDVEMRTDSIFGIASMTKPITSVSVMMLIEEGKLDLDDPISEYLPLLKNPEVITHFDESEITYKTKCADKEITIRHLLTHTAGFGYAFCNHALHLLRRKTGKGPTELPLLYEPGSRWMYGVSTRILGDLIEERTGVSLDEHLRATILAPLGMDDTVFTLPREKYSRWVTLHRREGGVLIEQPKPETQQPVIFGDSHLFSTARDYIKFLQMFLNGGTLHKAKILSEASIDLMVQNQIGDLVVEIQPSVDPALSREFPLGAGIDKFGLGFQIAAANERTPNLRSPGSYSWCGINNTYFWVDPQKEIAAVILMQVLPFYDETCIRIYQNFEKLVYKNL